MTKSSKIPYLCGIIFTSKVKLRAHRKESGHRRVKVKTEKPKKVHICDMCGKGYKTNYDLKDHVRSIHDKDRPFKCEKCGASYPHRGGLHYHKKEEGRCPGAPIKTRKLIWWGKGVKFQDPKCIHPDCKDKELPTFNFNGIMKHIIEEHSPDPDDSVSFLLYSCLHHYF